MMPIRYSTNWMGPVSINWYKDRGLTKMVTKVMEKDSTFTNRKKGDEYTVEEVTENYCAGRIDIRGTDGGGKWIDDEYGLEPMRAEDWGLLSDWLDTVETDGVWSKEDLLHNFERFIGRKISWADSNDTTTT